MPPPVLTQLRFAAYLNNVNTHLLGSADCRGWTCWRLLCGLATWQGHACLRLLLH